MCVCVELLCCAGGGVAVHGGGDVKQKIRQLCYIDMAGWLLNEFFFPTELNFALYWNCTFNSYA